MFIETLTILAQGGQWVVLTNNPKTSALFGTNVLPTPFSTSFPLASVVEKIKQLNPDSIVETA